MKDEKTDKRRKYWFRFGGVETFYTGVDFAEAFRELVKDDIWKDRLPELTSVEVEVDSVVLRRVQLSKKEL